MFKIYSSAKAPETLGAYSQAVKINNILYLSGQLGIEPETNRLVKGGIVAQTEQAFNNIKYILEEAGLTLANIFKVTLYLTDIVDFEEVNQAYATYFKAPYPIRTTVVVKSLPLGASLELDVQAVCEPN